MLTKYFSFLCCLKNCSKLSQDLFNCEVILTKITLLTFLGEYYPRQFTSSMSHHCMHFASNYEVVKLHMSPFHCSSITTTSVKVKNAFTYG